VRFIPAQAGHTRPDQPPGRLTSVHPRAGGAHAERDNLLPGIGGSVDHGTAFGIAGTARANHVNMHAAIAYGRRLAAARRA